VSFSREKVTVEEPLHHCINGKAGLSEQLFKEAPLMLEMVTV
jgi:hypothetical protein